MRFGTFISCYTFLFFLNGINCLRYLKKSAPLYNVILLFHQLIYNLLNPKTDVFMTTVYSNVFQKEFIQNIFQYKWSTRD